MKYTYHYQLCCLFSGWLLCTYEMDACALILPLLHSIWACMHMHIYYIRIWLWYKRQMPLMPFAMVIGFGYKFFVSCIERLSFFCSSLSLSTHCGHCGPRINEVWSDIMHLNHNCFFLFIVVSFGRIILFEDVSRIYIYYLYCIFNLNVAKEERNKRMELLRVSSNNAVCAQFCVFACAVLFDCNPFIIKMEYTYIYSCINIICLCWYYTYIIFVL